MKALFYRFAGGRSFAKFLSVLAFAALGFIYSSDAYAALVLHGVTGTRNPYKWDGQCVDTVTKKVVTNTNCKFGQTGGAPNIGYLYRGPDSAGKFYRTSVCWNRLLGTTEPTSPPNANACSLATGFISSSFSHHGILIEGGDGDPFTISLGGENPNEQFMWVDLSVAGQVTVNIDIAKTTVAGFDVNNGNASLGEGDFQYHVQFTTPIVTTDLNKGHGNDCSKCDPNNPGKKGSNCTGCSINQTCTNLSSTESQFTVKIFAQPLVTVTGFLKWLDPNPNTTGDTPPAFTNCVDDATDCILQLGGLPMTNGQFDPTLAAQFFPAVDVLGDPNKHLDVRQLVLFQQNYVGQCLSPTLTMFGSEDPQGKGLHRECNSDYGSGNPPGTFVPRVPSFLGGEGFDNVFRGCVLEDNAVHVATGTETARSREVAVDVTPQSVNLGCGADPENDQGVATAAICGAIDNDVNQIALGSKPKLLDLAPVLFVEGGTTIVRPIGSNIGANTVGQCSGDTFPDLNLIYKTCNSQGTGLAQAIFKDVAPLNDNDTVTLILQGQEKPNGTPVILQGSDTVKVVSVPAP